MKIGDIVSRKKYHQDIIFEVIDIQENICYLRGIEYRLIADSEIDDLELVQDKSNRRCAFTTRKMFKGKCFTFRWRSFLFKDVYEKISRIWY